MALVIHEFNLELSPGRRTDTVITAKQGDIGRPYKAKLFWDGDQWTADNYEVALRGRKSDGTVFDYRTPTIAGSTVSFATTEQMTVIDGPVECELSFSNGGIVIATANFELNVKASPYDPDAISESDVPSLTELIDEAVEEAVKDKKGDKGDPGPQGPKGDKGDPGTPGQDGADGAPGKDGQDGQDGEPGPPNVLTIGTVEDGENASASITGTSPAQVLNLVLPRGEKGETGATGQPGQAGQAGQPGPANVLTIGTVTSGATASATITGTSPNQVLNLVLPQGPQGETGPQGEEGPQGETGPQGPAGANGTNGTNGTDGTDGTTFTPSVSSAGVISWTNDGGKTNPASVDLVSAVISALPSAVGVSF